MPRLIPWDIDRSNCDVEWPRTTLLWDTARKSQAPPEQGVDRLQPPPNRIESGVDERVILSIEMKGPFIDVGMGMGSGVIVLIGTRSNCVECRGKTRLVIKPPQNREANGLPVVSA